MSDKKPKEPGKVDVGTAIKSSRSLREQEMEKMFPGSTGVQDDHKKCKDGLCKGHGGAKKY